MRPEALALLRDPATGEALALDASAEDLAAHEVSSAVLTATSGARFEIANGIPSFVAREVLDEQTVRSFADKWAAHGYYREHTREFYTSWYLARFGFGSREALAAFLADVKTVLDVGTGAGRDASNFLACSNAIVFGVDTAWSALATAAADPARRAALEVDARVVELVHADLHALPFADDSFDFISCDQVIHHTPEPRVAFEALAKKLRPGGQICVYVYRKKSVLREFTDDYVRERIKHGSFEEAMAVTEGITKLGRAFAGLRATVTIDEDVPVLGITKGTYDVQRFLHWHVLKCFWNDDFDFFTNNVVNADWYHPTHCHRFTPEEFRSWFPSERWEVVAWDEQEAGLSCRARKR